MAKKRKSTAHSQPVRFYKTVALTFLVLTIVLIGVVIFMSSKRATITIVTKETPMDVTETAIIGLGDDVSVSGTVTTTDIVLRQNFQPTGNKEEPGVATGMVTLHNESASDQPLVATTRLLTQDDVLFRLTDGVTVPAGGTVKAEIYADVEGASGDIGPQSRFTIPGLNPTRQEQVYASSEEPTSGGVRMIGVVSNEDVQRATQTLLEKAVQTIQEEYEKRDTDRAVLYAVVSHSATSDAPEGEEVSEYAVTLNARIATIEYDMQALKAWAIDELEERIVDDSEFIRASSADPTVTFESYDAAKNQATVSVFYDGVASLNPDTEQLQKVVFFGKSEDEIRRYLLSLDHVHAVEVDFSPVWVRTVPHVAEHVNVVVKSVR